MDYNYEWIIANKNASYSSSSASFANLRTYHGIFVKNINENYDRMVMLSKFFEEFEFNSDRINLDSNYYPGTVFPDGRKYLSDLNDDPYPQFVYSSQNFKIKKSIIMHPLKDVLIIKYEMDPEPEIARFYPLLSFRNSNDIIRKGDRIFVWQKNGKFVHFSSVQNNLWIGSDGNFITDNLWYYNFQYPVEIERGSHYEEDLYLPGHFELRHPGKNIEITIHSDASYAGESFDDTLKEYIKSRYKIRSNRINIKNMYEKANIFLLKNNIIAGYYWFGPWGRDTFISLPGLALIPGRYELARDILFTYMRQMKNGIIPKTMVGEYDAADVSLWFIYAVYKYYEYTKDVNTIRHFMPAIKEIIDGYIRGNDYYFMENNLIKLKMGKLTWMDAEYNNIIFTPRSGMPVEINALWYNALKTYEFLCNEVSIGYDDSYKNIYKYIEKNFENLYMHDGKIYDVLPDDFRLRPNFIFAFSLPFPVLNNFNKYKNQVDKYLITPYGLRTLSPEDPDYIPVYTGDRLHRDRAYHNGIIWPWLAGPYITAAVRSGNSASDLLDYFSSLYNMRKIPELFDDDGTPKGCILQAWSYGELIRSYFEDLGGN
ncbi:amylo-alpha-1,6-glucosidase [Acidiplasma cupricumulans]|uniref:Glycogen debranching protein n=1 Tax=Acidiplasma cupricumulans TaxID=312540 RepID=A0A0Q0VXE9_9ARCH|nr:amylo-alpha-1,6-glucosidase [Acidiplasma cupricumulans]KQB36367.1 hypothetical protein AOG55_00340 [Acidiplasma cupricumulans]